VTLVFVAKQAKSPKELRGQKSGGTTGAKRAKVKCKAATNKKGKDIVWSLLKNKESLIKNLRINLASFLKKKALLKVSDF
jgi:hypothetical protein